MATFPLELTLQDEPAIFHLDAGSFATLEDVGTAVDLEPTFDMRSVGSRADVIGGRPLPHEQRQGLDQNRFSGPGLSAEYGETRAELKGKLVDDGEIADAELAQQRPGSLLGDATGRSGARRPTGACA